MVFSAGDGQKKNTVVLWLLGLGFWVQGFRCFPWMGVNFFLKDGLGVSPSTLQLLYNFANLPMIGKPLYGVISDAVYIGGGHRLPYLAIGAMLQAVSWLIIVLLKRTSISIYTFSVFLLLGNLGASIGEVVNDAVVAEAGKQYSGSSGQLQSFGWVSYSAAGAVGSLLAGMAIDEVRPAAMFLAFVLLLTVQLFVTVVVPESALNLPQQKKTPHSKPVMIKKQLLCLQTALHTPEIQRSIGWFAISYAVVPSLAGIMFYYQTQELRIDPSIIGMSKVVGQGTLLAWSLVYSKWLREVPPRKLLSTLQCATAVMVLSDALFVTGIYRAAGLSDSTYVLVVSGFTEALFQFKTLPFSVLVAGLCPAGCEGSLMAFVMSTVALAGIINGFLGVALVRLLRVSDVDFSRLSSATLVTAACAALPLYWTSWIDIDGQEFAQFKIK